MKKYVLALDQGTTSSRAILFDKEQNIVGMAQKELAQIYPQPGWVEEDPTEIYANQYGVMMEVIAKSGVKSEEIAGIGITNQRETTILWDKVTGKPIYNAIVWQCRRTADDCITMKERGLEPYYGSVDIAGVPIPICGVAGDQQAALFGQACFEKGETKNTYGTGCFLLMNTGEKLCVSRHGLITTASASLRGEPRTYALEGSVFVGGAVIQWLRDGLGLIREAADSEYFAGKVCDNGGVFVVPALTGLGAPYWDMYARGTIVGLTRGSNSNHIIRAALESIAFQTEDLLDAMRTEVKEPIPALRVDGGASNNDFLMQFQADISNIDVERCETAETTALGAAFLAGLTSGFWQDRTELRKLRHVRDTFHPEMQSHCRNEQKRLWRKAVQCAMRWAK